MSLFKYFRSGIYLEKALRYNELYFSANHELNDPNDLVSFYEFEDDESKWSRLLELTKISDVWEIKDLYCLEDDFIPAINSFFKGQKVPSGFFSIQSFFKEIDSELDKFLTPFINSCLEKDAKPESSLENKLSRFKLTLKELLARGMNMKFFSVSFSEDALNPMMWAHYADGFKGCVIIYKAENDIIRLTEHLYSNKYIPTKVMSVSYDDGDKTIPLLTCADNEAKHFIIQDKLLIKNRFWKYENEKRAFVVNEQKTVLMAAATKGKIKDDPREKIYHHLPNEITGVIFGPNFDIHKKDKIEYTLRHNKHFSRAGDFFVFDTELSPSGEILIHEGRKCIVTDLYGNMCFMSQIFEGEKLSELKKHIGIKEYIAH